MSVVHFGAARYPGPGAAGGDPVVIRPGEPPVAGGRAVGLAHESFTFAVEAG